MDRTLFNSNGEAEAYISDDYHETIYLWDGTPVAYLYTERHVYGINGRHLGWFIDDILYNNNGERVGFTLSSCPVAIAKEPVKNEKRSRDEIRSRWSAPPTPKLTFNFAEPALSDFLGEGQVDRYREETPTEESEGSEESSD